MHDADKDTAEFEVAPEFSDKFFDPSEHHLHFEFGAATHQGRVRPNNEDHYAVVRRRRTSELILTNLPPSDLVLADDSAYGMVVADGMGGPKFGELASRMALQRMFELAQQATSWVTRLKDLDAQQIRERVEAYVKRIQTTLRDQIHADPELAGMGTTWTSAHLMSDRALVVHIGDSRAYVLQQGELHQVTHDETVAQALIDSGAEPQSVSKFRHMLINSFGGETDDVKAQIYQLQIDAGDQILLCTDGLTDMLSDEGIASILQTSTSPQSACDRLIGAALENGGHDNVTVVLAAAM
jgi:serine/threonine protein phosphatase PrpC